MNRQTALNHELFVVSKVEKGRDGSGKVIQNSFPKLVDINLFIR